MIVLAKAMPVSLGLKSSNTGFSLGLQLVRARASNVNRRGRRGENKKNPFDCGVILSRHSVSSASSAVKARKLIAARKRTRDRGRIAGEKAKEKQSAPGRVKDISAGRDAGLRASL